MTVKELHDQVFGLPDADRAVLAADLLSSLPAVLAEEDEGVSEAQRRSLDLNQHPELGMTWFEIKSDLGR